MVKHPLSNFIILPTLMQVFVQTHLTVHDNDHGLVSNKHDKYLVDDMSSLHEDLASSVRSSALSDLNKKLLLKFDPEFLDFQQRPLGMPHLEKVTLFNIDSNNSIDMTSISGSTVHFHSSFFEDKKIPPLGNTSFNVVFLGREEGAIESNLFIHTTEGHFKYSVRGASVSSPYWLRPIVGIKLPLNTTFSPLIHMHNPYTETIQIVEIYSSGGDFHLELPSGELEGPRNMWEIPPLQTKAVIRVRFHARTEQNHTAYVRIKLNNTEEVLVVPLEVEVTSSAGLYAPQGSVDFGVGGSLESPTQFDLLVQNPLKKAVRIHSITSASKAIKIQYENVKIPPDVRSVKGVSPPTKIATLTLDWEAAHENSEFSGKIVVKYKNGKSKTEIPYYLTVLEGGISFNASFTTYFADESPKQMASRHVTIKNNFLTPLALTNVSLPVEAQNYFNILNFTPVILKPQEEMTVFKLDLKTDVVLANLKLNSFILLNTNISTVELPLLSYNGKLQVHFPYVCKDNSLNLGLVSVDTKKTVHFLVLNSNPVSINLRQVTTSLPGSLVEVVGCKGGNHTNALLFDLSKNITTCIKLKPDEFAIIGLTIHSPYAEGQVWGDVVVETQYERLSIPVHYRVAQGKLEIGPDRLVFDQCFPGKICSHPLRVHSTFNDPMVIENLVSIPPDPRLSSKHLGHIMARSTKVIGHLYLDPTLGCQNECYLGLNADDTAQWLQTLTLPNSTPELDLGLVNVLYNRYLNATSNGSKRWQNLTMRLDTSEVKWHLFKTRVKMSWPSLVVNNHPSNGTVIKFPLTQVGNVTYYNVTLRNPSSHNLIIQVVMNPTYPGFNMLHDGLPPTFIHLACDTFISNWEFFFRTGRVKNNLFKGKIHVAAHDSSLPVLLPPGENFTFTLGFKTHDSISKTAFLYLRNNLTIIEVIQLIGQGAVPNFKFGNRKPSSTQPLAFELTEKHLKDCEHKKHPSPNLTVKRTFTARNMGDISIFVTGFFINGIPCEGYGFKVLNCESFLLPPNTTKKIDIAFTPDFTLAKIMRTLSLETSLNVPVNYTLVTTVPPAYLLPCSLALTRPIFEPYLYYMMLSSMCILLIFVIAMIVIEAEQTMKEAVLFGSRSNPTIQPTLDLRLIGTQARSEIRSQKSEEPVKEKKVEECIKGNETDIISLMDDGPGKALNKPETEKYTALIPAVGKSKKKLTKKSSNELSSPEGADLHKKFFGEVAKHKAKQEKHENDCIKKSQDAATKDKKAYHLKKIKSEALEEETSSSTATESSSNNEEAEKEPDKIARLQNNNNANKKAALKIPNSIVSKSPEQSKETSTKVAFKKTPRKTIQRIKDKDENKYEVKPVIEQVKKVNKTPGKERREKQPLIKKSSIEKKYIDNHMLNSATRISPTMQYSVWGENRATFSDVVARNDNTPTAPLQTRLPLQVQTHTAKPTMYVEPYKQTNTDLGPIGSRKNEFHHDNHGHQSQDQQQFNQISNSFFSDHSMPVDNPGPSLTFGESWDTHNTASQLLNLMQSNIGCSESTDPWNHQSTNMTRFWDTTQTQSAMNETFQSPPPPSSQINQDSGYLWGSSSVWQPWAPSELPRTPTRSPPGFPNTREMEERLQQHNQVYDLFGMTNIWAQQYPNPWNYPQGQ